jgi:hypothetical protein
MRAQRVRKPTAKAFIQKKDTLSTVSEAHKAFVFSTESSNAKITKVCVQGSIHLPSVKSDISFL